jgi:hypothetical protein
MSKQSATLERELRDRAWLNEQELDAWEVALRLDSGHLPPGCNCLIRMARHALRSIESEMKDSITYADIRRQIDHIEKNGMDVKKLGGEMVDEGRCRELCAMYLREFIQTHEMGKRLQELDLGRPK